MKCRVCGSELTSTVTDLPFKLSGRTIVVMKELPVLQCAGCAEFLIEDPIMERLETILEKVDKSAELEVVRYAA